MGVDLVNRRKAELCRKLMSIGYRNLRHRAIYLCDDLELEEEVKPILKELIYLINLEK